MRNPFERAIVTLESMSGMSWDEARGRAGIKGDREWWASLLYWPPKAEEKIAEAFGVQRVDVANVLRTLGCGVTVVWHRNKDSRELSGLVRFVEPGEPKEMPAVVSQVPMARVTRDQTQERDRMLRFLRGNE